MELKTDLDMHSDVQLIVSREMVLLSKHGGNIEVISQKLTFGAWGSIPAESS